MKRFALAFLVPLSIGCAIQKPVAPVAPLAPVQAMPVPITVSIHLCALDDDRPVCDAKRRQWQRKKDERDLIELLLEDFKDTATLPSGGRRDRIDALAARLKKEDAD